MVKKAVILLLCLLLVFSSSSCKKENGTSGINITKDEKKPGAVDTNADSENEESENVGISIGDKVIFGKYEQDGNAGNGKEPVEWIVADKSDGECLLIAEYALQSLQYNKSRNSVRWENSSLREWLNGEFADDCFDSAEKDGIIESDTGCDGSKTSDKVFVLSIEEAELYFPSDEKRRASATEYAEKCGSYSENGYCGWWLRSSGDAEGVAARVNMYGEILTTDSSVGGVERTDYSVRPAIRVSLDSISR